MKLSKSQLNDVEELVYTVEDEDDLRFLSNILLSEETDEEGLRRIKDITEGTKGYGYEE